MQHQKSMWLAVVTMTARQHQASDTPSVKRWRSRPIHTGRRRQRLSLTLNGVKSSVAELNCGSVASLHWRCSRQKLKTFQAPTEASTNQIALCKYPSADASQSRSCNTRKVCDWLLSLWRRVSTKLQTRPPSSVDADAPCECSVNGTDFLRS